MSTRSNVSVTLSNGSIKSIYVHHDGYVENGVGEMLVTHHNNQEFAELVVYHGNASSICENSEPLTSSHSFDNRENGVSVYYGRDRNETDNDAITFESYDDYIENCVKSENYWDIEFFYHFDGDTWNVLKAGVHYSEPVNVKFTTVESLL
jgi:hypothetical protein